MMASMLSSPTPARVSQNLPIPKCSTCNQFVPLEELGEHICALTSVPMPPPKRLQGRTPSPGPRGPIPSTSQSSSPLRWASPSLSQSRAPALPVSRGSKLPPVKGSNSPTKVTFQLPLATSKVGSQPNNAATSRDTPSSSSSMLTRPPQGDTLRPRPRAPSNASINQPTSATARPMMYQDTPYPQTLGPPPRNPLPPSPGQGMTPIRNLSPSSRGGPPLGYRGLPSGPSASRSGTPATMLPTGNIIPPRNMGSPAPQKIVNFSGTIGPGAIAPTTDSPQQSFVPPPERGIDTKIGGEAGMAGVGRRGFAAVARAAMFASPPSRPSEPQTQRKLNPPNHLDLDAVSRSIETPPLAATSAHSPQLKFASQTTATNITRSSSPTDQFVSTPTQSISLKPATSDPINSPRFPFFEKFKNKAPDNSSTSNSANKANNNLSISSLNPSTSAPTSLVRKNTSDSIVSAMLSLSVTASTNSSRVVKDVRRPISPVDSESEYGGLAYADSTDYEDNDHELLTSQSRDGSRPNMPSLILRNSSLRHHHSASEHSENNNDRIGISTRPWPIHSRNTSTSSISSAGGGGSFTRDRANSSNSSVIAQALGLSQTPPGDYARLGGPGVMGMGGRLGQRESSSSRRNAGPESKEEMDKALQEAKIKVTSKKPSFGSSSQHSLLYRVDTTSSVASSRKGDNVIGSPGGGPLKAHRSNTIQTPHLNSPEGKPVKLPMRALTSPKVERDKALDGTSVKEMVRKTKVCLKCQNVIDNGRWVSVDAGGVLCEKCWKNMYLPKCRRCTLSIEKQAVSSSDGQLKGKYHKECFNCDICHKPFPDKTFYVYDGKPLCAYHYHEANDSLCAATRCGQPIEGPCAVSHSGDRYHPEHMTCEHPGYPPCKQMLSEYWEIDGRMLCERHVHSASVHGSDEGDEEWAKSTRAKKRVTRFIDLAGGVGGFGGGVGVDDSELR